MIRYLFGVSKCPECRQPFGLVDAIAEIDEKLNRNRQLL